MMKRLDNFRKNKKLKINRYYKPSKNKKLKIRKLYNLKKIRIRKLCNLKKNKKHQFSLLFNKNKK